LPNADKQLCKLFEPLPPEIQTQQIFNAVNVGKKNPRPHRVMD